MPLLSEAKMKDYLQTVAKDIPTGDGVIAERTNDTKMFTSVGCIHYAVEFTPGVIVVISVDHCGDLIGSCGFVTNNVWNSRRKE